MSDATYTHVSHVRREQPSHFKFRMLRLYAIIRRALLPGHEMEVRNSALMRKLSRESTHDGP